MVIPRFRQAFQHPAWISDFHDFARLVGQSLLVVVRADLPGDAALIVRPRGLVVEISILSWFLPRRVRFPVLGLLIVISPLLAHSHIRVTTLCEFGYRWNESGFWKDTSGKDSAFICSGCPRCSEDCGVRNARDPVALVAVLPPTCRLALPTAPDLIPLGDGEPRIFDRGPAAGTLPLGAAPRVDDGDTDIVDQRGLIAYLLTDYLVTKIHEGAETKIL